MTKVYISGPMARLGKEEYICRFMRAERQLRGEGFKVFNPVRWGWFLKYLPLRFILAFDLFMMCFCDRVYMLDGWYDSDGATLEHRFAITTGMIIVYEV